MNQSSFLAASAELSSIDPYHILRLFTQWLSNSLECGKDHEQKLCTVYLGEILGSHEPEWQSLHYQELN